MKNVRHSVFETNSSSTHSISISASSDGIYDTIEPNDGVIVLNGGEFGWEWDRSNDPLTKANYAAVDSLSEREMLIKVIKEHTGAKSVVFNFSNSYNDEHGLSWAYVDHQSQGTSSKAFESEQALKDFIFSPKSWLFTGNDNEYSPSNFYDEPGTKYKYQLSIDENDDVVKFQKKPKRAELLSALESLVYKHPKMLLGYSGSGHWSYYDGDYQLDQDGKVLNSTENLKGQKVTIFKTKSVYSDDTKNNYLGAKLLDSCVISFSLTKI